MHGVAGKKTFGSRAAAEAYRLQRKRDRERDGETDPRSNRTAEPPSVEPLHAAEVIDLTFEPCGVCGEAAEYGHASFRLQNADGTPGPYAHMFCRRHLQEAKQDRVYTCACPPCNNVVDSNTAQFKHPEYGLVRLCSEHRALQDEWNCCPACPLMYKAPRCATCSECQENGRKRWC